MVTTIKKVSSLDPKGQCHLAMVYVESAMWVLNDDPRLTSPTLRKGRF